MTRILLTILFIINLLSVSAWRSVDTTNAKIKVDSVQYWKVEATTILSFNQVYLQNWSAGGNNSISGKTNINIDADYKKNDFIFDNNINLLYGLIRFKGKPVQKSDDKFDLTSSVGWKASKKWYYSTELNIKTQFTNGYKYPNDSVAISRFFAPTYSTLSLGMKYKPKDYIYIFLSPAAGKITFVADPELANKGSFGVTPAVVDTAGNIITEGKHYKAEFGINIIMKIKKEIIKNIKFESKINLYNNYFHETESNRWDIDVDWESRLSFIVNKHIITTFYTRLIYDHDVLFPDYETIDGVETEIGKSPKLQLNESFGVGLSFKF